MAPRTIYLAAFRPFPRSRAHFAIWVPSATKPDVGSLIHVVGAPMAGFQLEFRRTYNPALSKQKHGVWPIGQVDSSHIHEFPDTGPMVIDYNPKGNLEIAALQVRPPGISANFMAPVNDVSSFFDLWTCSLLTDDCYRPQTKDVKSGPWSTSATWLRKDISELKRSRSSTLTVTLLILELDYGR